MLSGGVSAEFQENREAFQNSTDQELFLSELAAKFGFSNITYFFLSSKTVTGNPGKLLTTYAKDWQEHYFSMNYDEIDPIVLAGMRSFLPMEWTMVPRIKKTTKQFFGEAMEFGVSDQGVTVPVRGPNGETALVSFNSEFGQSDWSAYLKHIKSDIVYFAHLLHDAMLETIGHRDGGKTVELTKREKEVLQWAAMGKISKDTATILDLSERTVEFYHKNAAVKLGACTKTQAVSRAISKGHILPDIAI